VEEREDTARLLQSDTRRSLSGASAQTGYPSAEARPRVPLHALVWIDPRAPGNFTGRPLRGLHSSTVLQNNSDRREDSSRYPDQLHAEALLSSEWIAMAMMTSVAMPTDVMEGQKTKIAPKEDTRPKNIPPFHVVLLDDDDHTYEYVIQMLRRLFGYTEEEGYQLACAVDTTGRVIVDTTTKERAEFKRDQIHAFGRDWRLARSAGSMTAVIEPAG
jgi:ATP-dependent Clp protease adaptor protein ClpS